VSPAKVPVALLWGESAFLLREAAFELLGDLQPTEVDGGEWRGGETSDLATPSLFGGRRALLVTDARSLPDAAVAELRAYLSNPAPDAPLVLCATVPERGKAPAPLSKLVAGVGQVREVKLARKDLPGWLIRRAQARGAQLAPDAAAALVDTLGEDPAELDQAATQLAAAFGDRRLTRELVAEQFRGLGQQHVWDLCDKAFGKDLPGAIRSVRAMLEAGEDPLPILGGIVSRLRDLLRVRSLPDRLSPADVAKRAGLRFDWQARRYQQQARRFALEELVELHARVVEADRTLKSGASGDVVLPVLVAAIAGDRELASLP
jgi:DNA polymerase-3 subunit delta